MPNLLLPCLSIMLSSDTPVGLNGWILLVGIYVVITSNISISQCSYCSADLSLTWKSSVIMASPFLLCLYSQHDFIVFVGELCWFFESALVLDQVHQWYQYFVLNLSDREYSCRWSPLFILTASILYTFCIFDVEVTNSLGVCHHVITDSVSHKNVVEVQHCQYIDGCKWNWCHCFSYSATD